MKNAKLSVINFNDNDVIATSIITVNIKVTWSDSGSALYVNNIPLQDGILYGNGIGGDIKVDGEYTYIGGERIDTKDEALSVYGTYLYNTETNTYTRKSE